MLSSIALHNIRPSRPSDRLRTSFKCLASYSPRSIPSLGACPVPPSHTKHQTPKHPFKRDSSSRSAEPGGNPASFMNRESAVSDVTAATLQGFFGKTQRVSCFQNVMTVQSTMTPSSTWTMRVEMRLCVRLVSAGEISIALYEGKYVGVVRFCPGRACPTFCTALG
jgi:hypothetical protein